MFGSIASLILPALVPAFSDGVRGIIAKFTGGAGGQPQNVEERVKLMEAEALLVLLHFVAMVVHCPSPPVS